MEGDVAVAYVVVEGDATLAGATPVAAVAERR
jgi:hypothetical protein